MAKILPLCEVKARLPQLIREVEEFEHEVIVTRNGRPAARLVSYARYESLKSTLDVLSNPQLMQQIRASEAEMAAGKKCFSFEEVFGGPLVPRRKKRKQRR